jgi:hypothetical protein
MVHDDGMGTESVSDAVTQGKGAVDRITQAMKRPLTGAAIAGGVVLGAAVMFGLAEAVVGAGVAYAAYRVIRKRNQAASSSSSS